MEIKCWCGNADLMPFSDNYVQCRQCQTLVSTYYQGRDMEDSQAIYNDDYWHGHMQQDLGLPDIQQRAKADITERCLYWLRTVLAYRLPPARTLELGCAHGGLVYLMNLAGFDASGLEMSSGTVDLARQTFDIPVFAGKIETQRFESGSLDIILLLDVLEHLPNPEQTIRHCASLLREDGILIIQTPQYTEGRTYEEIKKHQNSFLSQLKQNEHLFLFSKSAVTDFLKRIGFHHVVFETAIFKHYDMFLVAGRKELIRNDWSFVEQHLLASPTRHILALLDLYKQNEDLVERMNMFETAAIERLDVIFRQQSHISELEAERDRGAFRRLFSSLLRPLAGSISSLRPVKSDRIQKGKAHPDTLSERTDPLLSIIVPSYNQAKFLATCLDSIIIQTYKHKEIIVIDGESSDNSVKIIKKYQAHIAYWVSEKDSGQAEAINKGFSKAKGEIVTWLNSDDYYLPGALEAVVAAYQKHRDASFYYGNGLRVDERGSTKKIFFPEGTPPFNKRALVYGLNYILQPSTFINSNALSSVGMLDELLHYGLDTDLWIRLAKFAPPVPIFELLAASREYESTKTSQGGFIRVEELRNLACRHSNDPMTPGAFLYLLDTLHSYIKSGESAFDSAFTSDIEILWSSMARVMNALGASPEGFPLKDKSNMADKEEV